MRRWSELRPYERHSLVLMVAGLVYIGLGVAFLNADPLSGLQKRQLQVALNMAAVDVWGWVFITAGLMAFLSSRWPTWSETWGYMVLCGLSSAWAATYFLGYVFVDAPISNITFGLVWALMSFLWWAVSGLLNPARLPDERA